jgi:hypothetical protein
MRRAGCLLKTSAVTFVLCILGCVAQAPVGGGSVEPGDYETAMSDPWVRPLFRSHESFAMVPSASLFAVKFVVVEPKQAEAQARLRTTPWVAISADEAREYLGFSLEFDPGSEKLVLLRCAQVALRGSSQTMSRVTVEWSSGKVHVVSSAFRSTYVPVQHVAIVAVLPGLPSELFVDMATIVP